MNVFTGLSFVVAIGLATGFAFQRSRLCFVSAVRDLFLFRAAQMTRAILLLLALAAVGGAFVIVWRESLGLSLSLVRGPQALVTVGGGALFGLGMVLAGSCISGALWRLGEGQLSQLWILLGTMGGMWIYIGLWGWSSPAILPPARVPFWVGIGVLVLALIVLQWWDRHQIRAGEEQPFEEEISPLRKPWIPQMGALAVAALLVLYVALVGQTWAVTRAFVMQDWGPVLFVLSLIGGGWMGARWGYEFRLRGQGAIPERLIRLAGGLLMGYGARMAWGCTIGALLGGSVSHSPQLWYWLAGAVPGAWIGVQLLRRHMVRWL